MVTVNHRAVALLGVAICFYAVGKPIFGAISGSIPMMVGWSGLVVGLFIGLLPRREAVALYAATAAYELAELFAGLPQLQIEANAVFDFSKVASLLEDIPKTESESSWYVTTGAMVLGLIITVIVVKTIIKLMKSLWKQPFITVLFLSSWTPFLFIYIRITQVFHSGASLIVMMDIGKSVFMEFMIIMGVWFIVFSPLYGYIFFRWLGVYRRIPPIS